MELFRLLVILIDIAYEIMIEGKLMYLKNSELNSYPNVGFTSYGIF